MASLISTLARIVFGQPPELTCRREVWRAGIDELRHRTHGQREAGAFLLGRRGKRREIEEFVFYDDVDPNALSTGIVEIDGRRLGALWAHCRATGLCVVADVHVHPGGHGQSHSDQANPIIAEVGHIAVILPDFATGATSPGGIGVHQYLGNKRWRDRSRERPNPFHIGWWPG
ncbi:hypothetical protein EN978_34130 [Mesorhizobium sp. M7A.F.Ca.US.001.04.1.1]|uniref:hypothetical protein n=1 Tax=Mesorhizobium sp. M7A.F.Ca.US.001.04.1.1 TaxID=2496726 RepID=UPI000FCBCAE9|nr:hypothetical protein [Mesorhizobium sp. M7A.F.Ca.US.001.04.1.1]RUY22838.1 hypothetical protein EN979_30805 [Mesorhizobium sp. M7A.F.Ca.US.001.04.2.1]RUY34724.1 hypothetical protein EN978_34130 [Mesorhizobium sp. M7A.F.Ca.US.001.04.1.1]